MFNKIKDYTSNNVLNISGEMIINNKDNAKILDLSQEEETALSSIINTFQEKYSFLNIDTRHGLCDCTIKIFGYDVHIAQNNFLDDLNNDLNSMLAQILKNGTVDVRLNIFGKFIVQNEEKEFRYLNKQDFVKYKIVNTKKLDVEKKLLNRKTKTVIFVLVLLMIVGNICHQYYLDNYPSRVSNFVEEYIPFYKKDAVKETPETKNPPEEKQVQGTDSKSTKNVKLIPNAQEPKVL
jgi:hypothetical protein